MAGRLQEAIACWDQVLKAKANDATALCWRGLLLECPGNGEQARRDLERAWMDRKALGERCQAEAEQALQRLKA